MADRRKHRPSFEQLFAQGTGLLHSGKLLEAVELLEAAHDVRPEHVDAALNLGGAYILSGQFTKAVPLLERLSQDAPENEMVWTNLGAAYLGNPVLARKEERIGAIAAFKRAYELDPATPNVAYNIGLVYRDLNDRVEAVYWFREALRNNPGDKDAQALLKRLTQGE